MSRILRQQVRRKFLCTDMACKGGHGVDVDVQVGADHALALNIQDTQVKSVCSTRNVWKQMWKMKERTV